MLEKAREIMRQEGFAGLHFSAIKRGHQIELLEGPSKAEFNSTFLYPEMINRAEYQAYLESGTRRLPAEIVMRKLVIRGPKLTPVSNQK